MQRDEITARFTYQPPQTMQRVDDVEEASRIINSAAQDLHTVLPEGREKALVLTKLEEAQHWAHAAIVRQREAAGGAR